jgi:imidazolonepropionase-like amidohydrolase
MTTAIVNATILDGTGADPVPNGTIVIEEGRIERIGRGIEPPRGAEIIDAAGGTAMPGMIDCHVHLFGKVAPVHERPRLPISLQLFHGAKNALRTLDSGFTSVRDAGGSPQGFKMAIEEGLIPGPRMRISVTHLSQTGGHGDETMPSGIRLRSSGGAGAGAEWPDNLVDGPDEIRKRVREILRAGADFIKFSATGGVLSPTDEPEHTAFTPEEIAVMVHEAAAKGKTCMSHAQGTQGIKNAVLAGVESIEHCIYPDDETLDEMERRGTFMVPTLVAPVWVLRYAESAPGSLHPQSIRKAAEVVDAHQEAFRRALAAGVRIAFGTDQGVGPHGRNAEELELMVKCGMSPMQAIVAVTQTASECIHMADEIGTLAPGKLADILVIDGDPLAEIGMLRDRDRLQLIMQDGMAHKNLLETSGRRRDGRRATSRAATARR